MSGSELASGQRLASMAFSNAGHFITHLLMLLYPTVVLTLSGEFGMSYGELLALSLPGFILFGAAALPAGWLGDRWSTRGMMALFFFGCGFSAIFTGLATSPLGVAIGLGAIGLFASIYHPVGIAWLMGIAKNRGRVLGINGVFGNLGVALAASVAAALTAWFHWRAAFIVPGTLAVIAGVLFLFSIRSTAYRKSAAAQKGGPDGATPEMWRVFWVLGISTVCSGLVFQALTIAMPKLFADRLGGWTATVVGVGGFVTLVYVSGSLAQVISGFMMDKLPLKRLFLTLNITQVPLLALAAFTEGPALVAVIAVMMFFAMGVVPVPDMILARHTPVRWRGTVYGGRFVLALGVSSASVPLVGMIRDQTGGFTILLFLLAGMALLGTLAVLNLPADHGAAKPFPEPAPAPALPAAVAATAMLAGESGEARATA